MVKIAIWCRHDGDDIIGIGVHIPWYIPSDMKRFRRITDHAAIVCGRTTYETFPNRTLPNRKIYILTHDADYEVTDKSCHFVVNNPKDLKKLDEPLYICGGAGVYSMFMQKIAPEIIVDSCFKGELDTSYEGEVVEITDCIAKMKKDYRQISPDYEEDKVITTIWVKKGEFIPQEVLKHITTQIINH